MTIDTAAVRAEHQITELWGDERGGGAGGICSECDQFWGEQCTELDWCDALDEARAHLGTLSRNGNVVPVVGVKLAAGALVFRALGPVKAGGAWDGPVEVRDNTGELVWVGPADMEGWGHGSPGSMLSVTYSVDLMSHLGKRPQRVGEEMSAEVLAQIEGHPAAPLKPSDRPPVGPSDSRFTVLLATPNLCPRGSVAGDRPPNGWDWVAIFDGPDAVGHPAPDPDSLAEITHWSCSRGGYAEVQFTFLARLADGRWAVCEAGCGHATGWEIGGKVRWYVGGTRDEAIAQGFDRATRRAFGLELPDEALPAHLADPA